MTPIESPIEWKLADAIRRQCGEEIHYLPGGMTFDEFLDAYKAVPTSLAGAPQVSFHKYMRVDFVFAAETFVNREPAILVVECDGHDFHARTKEQASRDRSRERFFAKIGCLVMRFTGSEIHRDPMRCVEEIYDCLRWQTTHGFDDWYRMSEQVADHQKLEFII